MRKQYDGLYALVVSELNADPLCGDLFLFTNRRRTRAKVLLWDGTGLCIYEKRIERGRFVSLWRGDEEETVEMTLSELALFLAGAGETRVCSVAWSGWRQRCARHGARRPGAASSRSRI